MSDLTETLTGHGDTRWIVGPSNNPELLPPICLSGHRAGASFIDWLTPDEAADLGSRLCALALKHNANPNAAMGHLSVVDPPDRHLTVANEPARSGHEPDSPNDWPEP